MIATKPPKVLLLSLLLCACSVENVSSNDGTSADQPAPAEVAAAGAGPSQQPAEAPEAPEPVDGVTLSVSPEQTTEDSTVTLTLRNNSQQQIGYNLCSSTLQTSAGRPVPTSRACTMEIRSLDPGRTATDRYQLPVNMLEGRYRFVTQVQWRGSSRIAGVPSNAFAVRPD
jgi:hypothetical protein